MRLWWLLPITFLFFSVGASAQVDNVYVYGTVKDYFSSKKIDGVVVTVYKNGAKLAETVTAGSGKYEFNLDYGADYKLVYSKGGLVDKNITIDTRNIPEEERVGGHGMNVEMTLFNELPGIDFTILQKPIGKAKFDASTNEVTWDLEYTNNIRNEINRLMKEYEDRQKRAANADEDFAKLMSEGDAAMGAADYKKAVDSFTGALAIKANDPIATAKLSDAQMRLTEQEGDKKRNENYAALIKEADAFFGKKSYEEAKGKYQQASTIKDEEAYPKQKIKEIESLLAELAKKAEEERKAKELQEKYDAAVKAGDLAFKAEQYEDAKGKFTEATQLKPEEAYPKERLAAIAAAMEALAKKQEEERLKKELEAKYQAAIVAADAAFDAANFEASKAKYNEALGLKPEEKYPKDRLAAIEKKLEELAKKAEEERLARELQAKYDAAVKRGDDAFNAARYEEAKGGYNDALGLKPDEKYPKDRLAAIDKKLEELAKKAEEERLARELDEKYRGVVALADAAFSGEKYDEAKAKYNEALGLKPAEKYPKDRLKAIDDRLAEIARLAEEERLRMEMQARYQSLIDEADKLFGKEDYEASKKKYGEASGVKADERYPRDRIVEIDALLAERARKAEEERKRAEMEARYAELIALADKDFGKEKWSEALNNYTDASKLKPQEAYPKERIAEIEGKLDAAARETAEKERLEREARERDQRYNDLIAKADKAFKAKDLTAARTSYTDATSVKPEEQYPQDRLAEISALLLEQDRKAEEERLAAEAAAAEKARLEAERRRALANADALEQEYRAILTAGDQAFSKDQFEVARTKYTEAIAMRSDDPYPKERIAAIEAAIAKRLKDKDEAARLAEERRLAEEERLRREAEEAAMAAAANDAERRKLEEAKALEERYRKVIAEADLAFTDGAYSEARGAYSQALDIKPAEVYPASRIEQIDKLLADEEARRNAELAKKIEPPPPPPKKENTTIDIRKEQEAEQFMREARLREEAEKYERILKLKRDLSEQEHDRMTDASGRRDDAVGRSQMYRAANGELYQGSEAQRMRNADELEAFRRSVQEAEAQRRARGDQQRSDAQAEVDRIGSERSELAMDMSARHDTRVEAVQARTEEIMAEQAKDVRQGRDRNDQAREEVEALQAGQQAMQQRGEQLAEGNRARVTDDKNLQSRRGSQLSQRSADQRLAERERIEGTPLNKPKDFAEYNRSKLAQEYPPGVTEESYTEGNKVIIRRVVVNGNKADEFSKVIAKWGTFYFRNGQSITEVIWSAETE